MRDDRKPSRAEKAWIAAQDRFEADEEPGFAPASLTAQALVEVRLVLWLIFAVLCIIAWRIW